MNRLTIDKEKDNIIITCETSEDTIETKSQEQAIFRISNWIRGIPLRC